MTEPRNPCDEAFVAALAGRLPADTLRSPEPRHLEEPRGRWTGKAGTVALPRTVDEVATIVGACAASRVAVVPLGGGTGLVGGQVLPDGPAPLVLSLERMRAIRAVHADEGVMIVEAGAILADVQAAARAAGRLFPLSLASEGSARIGGLLAANAGGVNVLRYGNARDLCLGLEAVLPDGSVWHGLRRLRKDNTGYDLRNLLIGAEGTLGVITAACLRIFPQPAETAAAMLAVPDPAAALQLLALAQGRLAESVSAFELMAGEGLRFVAETLPEIRQPLPDLPDWTVLIDAGGPEGTTEALEALVEAAFEAGLVTDGVIAQSQAQRADFWALREHLPEANRRIGAVSNHDISVPLGSIATFVAGAEQRLRGTFGDMRTNCFGHVGDGNLHYNVFPAAGADPAPLRARRDEIKHCVHDLVHELGGSVSAEHGIGRLKVDDLEHYGDPAKLAAMRAIKAALDPAGIMNPGAVLREG